MPVMARPLTLSISSSGRRRAEIVRTGQRTGSRRDLRLSAPACDKVLAVVRRKLSPQRHKSLGSAKFGPTRATTPRASNARDELDAEDRDVRGADNWVGAAAVPACART